MKPLKLPQIIGHRGCAAYAPENTLEGIHTAADMGVEWVELDIKLTKDDVPILFHDDDLMRLTGSPTLVAEATYADLQMSDISADFTGGYGGAKIPTLEEALDVILQRNLGFNAEIKPCPGREVETAEIALDLLSQVWDDHARLLISSFAQESLQVAQDMAPDWHRGYLLGGEWPEDWAQQAQDLEASTIHVNGNTATPEQIEAALALGKPVLAFTINEALRARELQQMGITAIFTDAPDEVRDGLQTVH